MDLYQVHARIQELAEVCGITVSEHQAALLAQHLSLVEETNKQFNLTRITSYEDAVVLHVIDSLLLLPYMTNTPLPFLDFGTGAGFPGIPLGIMTGRKGLLLDSVGKKVKAVQGFIEQLGLDNLYAVQERVEQLGVEQPKGFSFVTARAVAALPVLVEYAAPLLCCHGVLCVSKGRPDAEELERGTVAAELCGMELLSSDTLELPLHYGTRTILCYQKIRKSKLKLPREVGKAKHQPLA